MSRLLLGRANELVSRLACLRIDVIRFRDGFRVLHESQHKIQTMVKEQASAGFKSYHQTAMQCPGLNDYADGVDTIEIFYCH